MVNTSDRAEIPWFCHAVLAPEITGCHGQTQVRSAIETVDQLCRVIRGH